MLETNQEAIYRIRIKRAESEVEELSALLDGLNKLDINAVSPESIELLDVLGDAIKSECSAVRQTIRFRKE